MSALSFLEFLWSFKFWFSLFVVLFLKSVLKIWLLRKRMPPGPTPLPFLGNILNFRGAKKGSQEIMAELAKKFGDPMTLFFGPTPAVILTKYDLAKSVLQETTFSSRQDSTSMKLLLGDGQDIILGKYGPLWQFHRKVTSKCMRSIIDAEKLENKVLDVVDWTVEDMLRHPDLVDPKLHVHHIVYNVLASFAFGQTYKIDDPEFLQLLKLSAEANKEFVKVLLLDFLPYGDYFSGFLRKLPMVKSALRIVGEYSAVRFREIEKHRKTLSDGETRDFCDAILREQQLLQREGPDQAQQLTDEHVSWILMDFFNAGTDTTAGVLTWIILYMVLNPEMQEECYQAIKEVVGHRPPCLSDRPKLSVVEAFIMETLRLRPPAPVGVPHAPTSDAQIGDYFIPEGSITFANIYAMQIDPDHWEKPLEFNPRLHFLDSDGQLKKPTSFAPFGFGRRICIGEQLAKNDLFLVVVRLLQNVRFEPIDGENYSTDYDVSQDLALMALPFSIRVSPRS